jgi:hypothetical protein
MKKLVFALGIFFALQTGLFAQVLTGDVVFNAHLLSTLNLNVDGVVQDITFQTATEYNDGVVESGTLGVAIYPGTTAISVEATEDWKLNIECPDFSGPDNIPINNLGVYVAQAGLHNLTTDCVCAFTTPATIKGLTTGPELLMNAGTAGNGGDIDDNAFTLHWEMGTQRNASMNPLSMFDQMAQGDFPIGEYTTTATLTLSLDN